jgi:hypothetical protein
MIGVGSLVQVGLAHHGLDPVGATFLGAALPAYFQYYLERGLSKLSSRWFAPPKKQSQPHLIAQCAFGGVVGVSASAFLNGLGRLFPSSATAAVNRFDTTVGVGLGRGAVAGLRIVAKKIHNRVFRLAAKKAKDEAMHAPVTRDLLVPVAAALK